MIYFISVISLQGTDIDSFTLCLADWKRKSQVAFYYILTELLSGGI